MSAPAESTSPATYAPGRRSTRWCWQSGVPIAIGWGAGAEIRQPLGLAVVGGLVVSQFLTLYLTPVIYLYLEKLGGAPGKQASAAG